MTGAAEPIRAAELTMALSLATDLGTGQPMEHGLRTCWLSTVCPGLWSLIDDRKASYRANADVGFTDLQSPSLDAAPADLTAIALPVLVLSGSESHPTSSRTRCVSSRRRSTVARRPHRHECPDRRGGRHEPEQQHRRRH